MLCYSTNYPLWKHMLTVPLPLVYSRSGTRKQFCWTGSLPLPCRCVRSRAVPRLSISDIDVLSEIRVTAAFYAVFHSFDSSWWVWRVTGIRFGKDERYWRLQWLEMVSPFIFRTTPLRGERPCPDWSKTPGCVEERYSYTKVRTNRFSRIFIIEGLATVVIGIAAKWMVVDWPETAKFLTPDERKLLLARLREEAGEARMDRLDKRAAKRAFSDWKIYCGVIMYFGVVNTGYSTSVSFSSTPNMN